MVLQRGYRGKTEEFILVDEDGSQRLSRAKSDVALFENWRGV